MRDRGILWLVFQGTWYPWFSEQLSKSLRAKAGEAPALLGMVWGELLTCLSFSFLVAVSHPQESVQGNAGHTKKSQMVLQLGSQASGL